MQFGFSFQKRPAETVDEEENTDADHKVQHQDGYAAVNGEIDQGEESGEAINGNGHEMEEDQTVQDEPSHAQGGTNEENGEEMDHNGHEEETKEGIDDQTQVTCLCSFVMIVLPNCSSNRLSAVLWSKSVCRFPFLLIISFI